MVDYNYPIMKAMKRHYRESRDTFEHAVILYGRYNDREWIEGGKAEVKREMKNSVERLSAAQRRLTDLIAKSEQEFSGEEQKDYVGTIRSHLSNINGWLERAQDCLNGLEGKAK